MNISPDEIDYISFDHLHTQDLRNWLGSNGAKGYFPNAKLLIMRKEWEAAQGLLPPQQDWYCPNGTSAIDPSRVVLLDNSVRVGDGVALVKTPGHTLGNHSLVANTDQGIFVTSENGVGADAYAPERSKIPAIQNYADKTGVEVILNGNTQESGLEQYISMVQEKEIAGPSLANPEFPSVVPSAEFTEYWLFRGMRPTFKFGNIERGTWKSVKCTNTSRKRFA